MTDQFPVAIAEFMAECPKCRDSEISRVHHGSHRKKQEDNITAKSRYEFDSQTTFLDCPPCDREHLINMCSNCKYVWISKVAPADMEN